MHRAFNYIKFPEEKEEIKFRSDYTSVPHEDLLVDGNTHLLCHSAPERYKKLQSTTHGPIEGAIPPHPTIKGANDLLLPVSHSPLLGQNWLAFQCLAAFSKQPSGTEVLFLLS